MPSLHCTYSISPKIWKNTCHNLLIVYNIARWWVGNSVDSDQMLHSTVSRMQHLGLHCLRGGWVRQRRPVAFVTGIPNWYWLTVGQGLLSLQQVRIEGECCYFFCSAAGKDRGGMLLFLLFLHFLSFPSFFTIPPFHLLYYLFSFLPFSNQSIKSLYCSLSPFYTATWGIPKLNCRHIEAKCVAM